MLPFQNKFGMNVVAIEGGKWR